MNFDEDNGGIVFNTDEGDGVISFDEDGIVFNTDEGNGTATFDDNGAFTIETEDGSSMPANGSVLQRVSITPRSLCGTAGDMIREDITGSCSCQGEKRQYGRLNRLVHIRRLRL